MQDLLRVIPVSFFYSIRETLALMKKIRMTAFMALMSCLVIAHAEGPRNLLVTASPWSPYVSVDLHDKGLVTSIVMTALRRANYNPTLVLREWPKDLEGTRAGEYDIIASIWFTEERARDLLFSSPIIENTVKYVVRADNDIRDTSPASLKGMRVGVVEDYAYRQGAYRDLPAELIKAETVEENMKRLLDGEIDIAVADERVALYVLNKRFPGSLKQIRFTPGSLSTRNLRAAVSRKRPDAQQIISEFDTALQHMKNDGTYMSTLNLYRVSP